MDMPVQEFGTDALRLYEMFMGPLEMVKPWSTKGVEGVYRFLGRVWRLFVDEKSETEFEQAETTAETQRRGELLNLIKLDSAIKDVPATPAQLKTLHACIKKVTEDLDGLRFNTAISALMVFVNDAMTWETKPVSVLRDFLILLQPFAPHLAEELWAKLQLRALRHFRPLRHSGLRALAQVRSGVARRKRDGNSRAGERQVARRHQGPGQRRQRRDWKPPPRHRKRCSRSSPARRSRKSSSCRRSW